MKEGERDDCPVCCRDFQKGHLSIGESIKMAASPIFTTVSAKLVLFSEGTQPDRHSP